MRFLILMLGVIVLGNVSAELWTIERLESFLRNSSRFVESDYDEDAEDDIPNRRRDAIPLFADVMSENGWTTNDLVTALTQVVSNGIIASNWESVDKRIAVAMSVRQLSDIDHPAVTNYFAGIITNDLHGLEKVIVPSMFKYTQLEPCVIENLWEFSAQTNRYDKVASIVVWDLLECISSMDEANRPAAKMRVAKFLYHSMRQVTESQTWQDEQLAKLIPAYSNSVERLDQVRYLKEHSTRIYERDKATQELDRLSAMPTNMLNSVPWILER